MGRNVCRYECNTLGAKVTRANTTIDTNVMQVDKRLMPKFLSLN